MENDGRTNGSPGLDYEIVTGLRDLGRRVAPADICDVWVFPPLPDLEDSAEFLLFTRFLPDQMRRLCGAECRPGNGAGRDAVVTNGNGGAGGSSGAARNGGSGEERNGTERVRRITEYGTVPDHRVYRVVAGFRERLGDHREPLHFEIGGSADSWGRLVNAEVAPDD